MTSNLKDLLAGLIFVAIAAVFGFGALGLELGTALRMGPGYFPLVLSLVLALLGLIIIARSFTTEGTPIGNVSARGVILILLAPVVFGLTLRGLGMVSSVALVALMGSLASMRTKPVTAIGSVVVLTIFCVAVFSYGLGVPLVLFGPWLDPVTHLFASGA